MGTQTNIIFTLIVPMKTFFVLLVLCVSVYCKFDGHTCWARSHNRGIGKKVDGDCPFNTVKQGGLCYPHCPKTMYGIGPLCKETCPWKGYEKKGQICAKKGLGNKENLKIAHVIFDRAKDFKTELARMVSFKAAATKAAEKRKLPHELNISNMKCSVWEKSLPASVKNYQKALKG